MNLFITDLRLLRRSGVSADVLQALPHAMVEAAMMTECRSFWTTTAPTTSISTASFEPARPWGTLDAQRQSLRARHPHVAALPQGAARRQDRVAGKSRGRGRLSCGAPARRFRIVSRPKTAGTNVVPIRPVP